MGADLNPNRLFPESCLVAVLQDEAYSQTLQKIALDYIYTVSL